MVPSSFQLNTGYFLLNLLFFSLWFLMAVPKHKRYKIVPSPHSYCGFSLAKRAGLVGSPLLYYPLKLSSRSSTKAASLPTQTRVGMEGFFPTLGYKNFLGSAIMTGGYNDEFFSSFYCQNHTSLKLGSFVNYSGYFFPRTPIFFSTYFLYWGF